MSKEKKVGEKPSSSYSVRQIHYEALENEIRTLSGKILTIVDASIVDEKRNKAVKDLIKGEIREMLFYYQGYCSGKKAGHSIPDNQLENSR